MAEIISRLKTTKNDVTTTSKAGKALKNTMNINTIQNITTITNTIMILREPSLKPFKEIGRRGEIITTIPLKPTRGEPRNGNHKEPGGIQTLSELET
jgi:hypothetical protein